MTAPAVVCALCKSRRCLIAETTLQTYLREINRYALLTADQEKTLARRVQAGDRDAWEEMVRANLRLVVNISRSYLGRGLTFMDLIEEGNLGLLRAVEGFEPSQGYRFSTYGSWWIKQAVKRAIINKAKTIRIPAYMVEMIAKAKGVSVVLQDRLGRPPSMEEIAGEMDLPREKIVIMKRAAQTVAAATGGDEDNPFGLAEMLADPNAKPPDEVLFEQYEKDTLYRLLDAIDEREAKVLRMRYGLGGIEPRTLKEIGEVLSLTRERVRQIENEALGKLNSQMVAEESGSDADEE